MIKKIIITKIFRNVKKYLDFSYYNDNNKIKDDNNNNNKMNKNKKKF